MSALAERILSGKSEIQNRMSHLISADPNSKDRTFAGNCKQLLQWTSLVNLWWGLKSTFNGLMVRDKVVTKCCLQLTTTFWPWYRLSLFWLVSTSFFSLSLNLLQRDFTCVVFFYDIQLPASEFKILVTLDDRSHLFVNGEPVLISRVNNSNS